MISKTRLAGWLVLAGSLVAPALAQQGAQMLHMGQAVPSFTLINQNNKKVSLRDYKGKVVLITFLYTQCPYPDKCPMVARKLKQTKELVDKIGDASKIEVMAVTIDPEHDTPATLRKYAQGLDKTTSWDFLTGKPADVHRVASAFGVLYYNSKGTIEHNLCTAIIDRQGNLAKIYTGSDWKPGQVAATLKEYLK
jgi:protein SCO1/2